jgi:hypothetical protein
MFNTLLPTLLNAHVLTLLGHLQGDGRIIIHKASLRWFQVCRKVSLQLSLMEAGNVIRSSDCRH